MIRIHPLFKLHLQLTVGGILLTQLAQGVDMAVVDIHPQIPMDLHDLPQPFLCGEPDHLDRHWGSPDP